MNPPLRPWVAAGALLAAFAVPLRGQESAESHALGILERAKQAGSEVRSWNPSKSEFYQAVAIAQARAGDAQASLATFQEVLEAAPLDAPDVAVSKWIAGDPKGALALAETLKDGRIPERKNAPVGGGAARQGSLRTLVLERIIGLLIDQKRWAEAPGILELLPETRREGFQPDMTSRQEALGKLAVAQAKAGDPASAQRTAESIKSPHYRQEAFAEVVAAWSRRADVTEALQADEAITHPHLKIGTLLSIATAQAKAGDGPGAKETFQRASDQAMRLQGFRAGPSPRVLALCRIAAAQLNGQDRAAAQETLRLAMEASGDEDRENIAVGQARVGALDLALSNADSIPVAWRRVRALVSIAGVMTEGGNLAKAEELISKARLTARAIPDEQLRMVSLLGVGKAQVEANLVSAALETAAELSAERSEKWELLQLIVKAQVDAGDLKGARSSADLLWIDWMKQVSLREIALALGRGGDARAAAGLVESFRGGIQAQSFKDLSSILLERGELEPARQMALRIDQTELGGQALRKIAFAQAKKGDEAGALAWASPRKGRLYLDWVLLGVAEGILAREGRNR